MIVEVRNAVNFVDLTNGRSTTAYQDITCIQGCVLSYYHNGKRHKMLTLNKDIYKAVFCEFCHNVRHLNLFKEIVL